MESVRTMIQNAHIVCSTGILRNSSVCFDRERILALDTPMNADRVVDAKQAYLAPGFVDIHCHASDVHWSHEDPEAVGRYHLSGGTTSLLCTFYQDVGRDGYLTGAEKVRLAIEQSRPGNIVGIHMEGPYLSPKFGAAAHTAQVPSPQDYELYISRFGDLVKQWTYAPEIEGNREFAEAVARAGIPLAIGHSEASPQQVYEAVAAGARICTHLGNASGCSIEPLRYDGTREMRFDDAAMLCHELYCEIIHDKGGIHVRHDMTKLMIQTIGISRAVGITDRCLGEDDGEEVNILNGELYGSKLKMNQCARNFARYSGLRMEEVFQVCAASPARAIGLSDVGEIKVGKRPNFVMIDEEYQILSVILKGEFVRQRERA